MSSIYLNGNLYWYKSYKNGKPTYRPLHTADKSEAKFMKAKLDQEAYHGGGAPSNTRCDVAVSLYIDVIRKKCTTEYVNATKRRLDKLTKDVDSVSEITEATINAYLETCKSRWDFNAAVAALKAWFKWCVRNDYISKNPSDAIKKIPIQERTRDSFTRETTELILKNAANETIYPLIALAVFTGMRKSELLRLDWKDIDLKSGTITVLLSKSRKIRRIPISSRLMAVLKPYRKPDGFICDLHNHRRILKRILKKSKVVGGWHHFRHTFGTHALQSGADLQTVCDLMGHSSPSVTAQYLHSTPTHHKAAVEALSFKTVIKTAITKKSHLISQVAFSSLLLVGLPRVELGTK